MPIVRIPLFVLIIAALVTCIDLWMHALFDELKETHPSVDTLSMGMSDDLEVAIAEGATMVRVGTAIFGQR